MKFFKILFVLLFASKIFSENSFSPYSLNTFPSSSAGLMSLGVGLGNSNSSLYSNPANLVKENRSLLDAGLNLHSWQNTYSALLPASGGFFVQQEKSWGYGINFKQNFSRQFPDSEKMISYNSSLFFAFQLNENFSISLGIGPSVVFRNNFQSSYSWSPFFSFAYTNGKHRIGGLLQSSGKFRYDIYRGSDFLIERLPEYFAFGYSYSLKKDLQIYYEIRKIFWESSQFVLNERDNKPYTERGLGAEIQNSLGFQKKMDSIPLLFQTGIELGGVYDQNGRNKRSLGIGFGISYFLQDAEKNDSYAFSFSIQRQGVFSKSGDRSPENLFNFSATCFFY
jgi:hypothetical protein